MHSALDNSGISGSLSREPSATATFFWNAAAGLKNMCANFDHRIVLKSVVDAVENSPDPLVLFIDEAHTLIGAGGQEGQNDAANLLKPALARGDLRTIAATTWACSMRGCSDAKPGTSCVARANASSAMRLARSPMACVQT